MDMKSCRSDRILFLDIETVSGCKHFSELCDTGQKLWIKKVGAKAHEHPPDELYAQAGLYAEFGKVICISAGYLRGQGSDCEMRIRSFCGHDEKQLLQEFSDLVTSYYSAGDQFLCAHNGRGFDFPFLARRMVIHQLDVPDPLNTSGKKPWELRLLDTMEMWKFGEWKSAVSLETLAWLFGIPTPKDDIDGSQVGEVYWAGNDLPRIREYCNKDVMTLIQVFLKMRQLPLVADDRKIVCDSVPSVRPGADDFAAGSS